MNMSVAWLGQATLTLDSPWEVQAPTHLFPSVTDNDCYGHQVVRTVKGVSPIRLCRAMSADKRIPVTEETRKELHELKEPGETYDELLQDLTQRRRRQDLEERFQDLEEKDSDELTPLSDV